MAQQPPNWYPDPEGGGGVRYWDGTQWTDRAPAAEKKRRGRGCLTLIGAAVVVTVLLIIIVVVAGSNTSNETKNGTSKGITADNSKDPRTQVKITSCAADPVLDLLVIKGTAENTTSKRSDYFIDLTITDSTGKTQLGSTNALASNVEPGQTAQWDAPSTVKPTSGAVCKVATVQRTASF